MARRLILLSFVAVLGCEAQASPPARQNGVVNGRVRHIQCWNRSGVLVVNTDDISRAPETTPTAWKWDNAARTKHTQVSVPSHECIYTSEVPAEQPAEVLAEAPAGG